MKYHILNVDGIKIASFVNESDRDVCLEALGNFFWDCDFDTQDD